MDLGLANATAVVVGGSRGMGLAASRCLASDGAWVALVGRTRASLDSAVADLKDRGSPDALGFAADIGSLPKAEILVNVVSPVSIASGSLVGWADTVGVDGNDPYRLMEAIDKHFGHPAHMPRAGLPEEIGPVVAFLALRRNSYMTGANINVDGGSDVI